MRLIFSKDRAAQLDLLLRSLDRFAPAEDTTVIWTATPGRLEQGYLEAPFSAEFVRQDEGGFDDAFRAALEEAFEGDDSVTLFCDDDVAFRPLASPYLPGEVVAFSHRLGVQNDRPKPDGFPVWLWGPLERTDFGFPASVDGHVFRASDLLSLIGGDVLENPTGVETIIAGRVEGVLGKRRPWMGCGHDQSIVGVPVNRVSTSSGVDHGLDFPQAVEKINRRWLLGQQINLDDAVEKLQSQVRGCHHEIRFEWEPRG